VTDKLSVGSTLSGERAVSIEVTQDDLQKVYDLIIATCEHDDAYHARGAKALRIIGALKDERDTFALHASPLREALEPFVSDCAIYLTGAEKDDDEHAVWVTTAQILAARRALSPSYPMENYNGD
jgi:hypothetical protein